MTCRQISLAPNAVGLPTGYQVWTSLWASLFLPEAGMNLRLRRTTICRSCLRRQLSNANRRISTANGRKSKLWVLGLPPIPSMWKKTIGEGFPSLHQGSLATNFQRAVFWPRNKVLHHGTASHTRDDAARMLQ